MCLHVPCSPPFLLDYRILRKHRVPAYAPTGLWPTIGPMRPCVTANRTCMWTSAGGPPSDCLRVPVPLLTYRTCGPVRHRQRTKNYGIYVLRKPAKDSPSSIDFRLLKLGAQRLVLHRPWCSCP